MDVKSCNELHMLLATYGNFEKVASYCKRTKQLYDNLNTLYNDMFNVNNEWVSNINADLCTITEKNFINNELEITIGISRAVDFFKDFSLYFEDCDYNILNKIEFLIDNQVIDCVTEQWLDIYNQMYDSRIINKNKNNILVPFFTYRHNILFYTQVFYHKKASIKIYFKRKLENNQKVILFGKATATNGAQRGELNRLFGKEVSFFYDKIVQTEFKLDTFSLGDTIEQLVDCKTSGLSEIFISVKKMNNYPEGKELIKNITLSCRDSYFYENKPSTYFKTIYPQLQNLTEAEENDNYQSHYLIAFSRTSKVTDKWCNRNVFGLEYGKELKLKIDYDESIPKDSYKIELSLVCPTYFKIDDLCSKCNA